MIINDISSFDEKSVEEAVKNNEEIAFDKKVVVLASASKSRREIMEDAKIPFVVIKNTLDESRIKCDIKSLEDAKDYVKKLAYEKAMTVVPLVKNAVIISADTIAYCEGEKLGKPKDRLDAYRILNKLSNTTHDVITGVCIADGENIDNFTVTSKITIKEISKEKIEEMVNDKNTYLYAGGYNIDDNLEGLASFDDKDFNNIKGLPIEEIMPKINL
ncbi:MAG: Maf-like protein [Clostridia bacterium]|nr:Maf-like protein [Clostridia bacterium]